MPGAPQRLGHVARHRTRYHKAVGVARGGHEMHTESLEVVVRAGQAPNLQLTAIARARVDLADGKRAAEARANLLGQSRPESLHLVRARRRLGDEAVLHGESELAQHAISAAVPRAARAAARAACSGCPRGGG